MHHLNLTCLGEKLSCYLDVFGGAALVTFRRLDDANSGEVHSIYRERRSDEKVYHSWVLSVIVDENPRKNIKGAMGAEVSQDIDFTLYRRKASGGSRAGDTYTPEHKDLVDYRGVTYEVTAIERIVPSGVDRQLGYQVSAKRYR